MTAATQAPVEPAEVKEAPAIRLVAVDLPDKGRYYRLRVETADGKALCAMLADKGLDCIPAKD